MVINWSAVQMANQSGNIYCSASDWLFFLLQNLLCMVIFWNIAILNVVRQAHFAEISNYQSNVRLQLPKLHLCNLESYVNRSSNVLAPDNSWGIPTKVHFHNQFENRRRHAHQPRTTWLWLLYGEGFVGWFFVFG